MSSLPFDDEATSSLILTSKNFRNQFDKDGASIDQKLSSLGRLACSVDGAAGMSIFIFAASLAVSLVVFSPVDKLVNTR